MALAYSWNKSTQMSKEQVISTSPSPVPTKNVVIVGAGLAGLAAAHTLSTTANPKNVSFDIKLLEAKPYPGGRVKSVPIQNGKYFTELGAYFLYYFDAAPNFTNFLESRMLASNKTVGTHNEIFTDTGIPNIHFLSNGEVIEFSSVRHYEKIFADVLEEMGECYDKDDWSYTIRKEWPKQNKKWLQSENISPEEYLEIRYFEVVETSTTLPLPAGCTPREIYNRMIVYEQFNNGTKICNLDMTGLGESYDPDGEYLERVSYSEIVSAILKEMPSDVLQCSSVVTAINWNNESDKVSSCDTKPPITVSCENGQCYEVHHVIITTSLGVLKVWTSNKVIKPSLPADKLDAILELGMGEGCSVMFDFPAPLLDKEHRVIELFWLKEDFQHFSKYPWVQSLDALIRVGESNTYGTWYSSDKAIGVEGASDAERIDGISLVLKRFLRKSIRPTKVTCGAWTSDPHTLGLYSYYPKETDDTDRVALSEPVGGSVPLQLLFAGEATHVSLFGTANGAFETGVREAKRLLEHYDNR